MVRFIRNTLLHKDFQLPIISEYIKKYIINFFKNINSASCEILQTKLFVYFTIYSILLTVFQKIKMTISY